MGAEDAPGGEGDEDANASLMSRLTDMKLGYRDLVSHNAQQVLRPPVNPEEGACLQGRPAYRPGLIGR